MVSLEFEKPSTWSIGKKIAAIAIIFLLIGAFLSVSLCLPIVSIVLMVFLLYLKFDIYLEKKDETRIKINHFVLILWGIWFLLSHLALILMFMSFQFELLPRILLIGMWLTVIGFLLCTIAGFLEWRYPSKAGLQVMIGKKKEKEVVTETSPESSPEVAASVDAKKPLPVVKVEEEVPKAGPVVEPGPIPVTANAKAKKIEAVSREPSTEEEKTLLRWARHIAEDGKTFEQCMKCEKYVFLKAKDTGDTIVFNCPECGESFTLKK